MSDGNLDQQPRLKSEFDTIVIHSEEASVVDLSDYRLDCSDVSEQRLDAFTIDVTSAIQTRPLYESERISIKNALLNSVKVVAAPKVI